VTTLSRAVFGTSGADGHGSFQASYLWSHTPTAQQVDTTGYVVGTSSVGGIIGMSRGYMLTGTTGNDFMVAKGGADSFAFASNFGRGVSNDFWPTHDTVQFSNSAFDSFASVLSRAALFGHDAGIATGSDTLMLHDTKLDALNHDFRFA
jgi:hypothetical protein